MHIHAHAPTRLDGYFLIADDVHEFAHDILPLSYCLGLYLVSIDSAFKGTVAMGIAFACMATRQRLWATPFAKNGAGE